MQTTKEKTPYGNFGIDAENYNNHRPAYHDSVFRYICSETNWKWKPGQTHFRFLDLGCGTGISTASLLNEIQIRLPKGSTFELIGLDKDEHMINVARQMVRDERVRFEVGEITDINVGSNFDMIICASAFHWIYKNAKSVKRIKSLLRGGLLGSGGKSPFVIINRIIDQPAGFSDFLRGLTQSYSSKNIPDIKKDYNPIAILQEHEFTLVSSIQLQVKSDVTVEEFENYAKTVSIWNMVDEARRPIAEDNLRGYLKTLEVNGVIEKIDHYRIVYGYRYNNPTPKTDKKETVKP